MVLNIYFAKLTLQKIQQVVQELSHPSQSINLTMIFTKLDIRHSVYMQEDFKVRTYSKQTCNNGSATKKNIVT
jgi:hypothetical protein